MFSITSLLVMKLCWPIRKTVSPLPFKGAFIFNSVLPPSKCHSTLALEVRAKLLWENPAFPQTTSSSLLLRTRGGTSRPPAYRDPHGSQTYVIVLLTNNFDKHTFGVFLRKWHLYLLCQLHQWGFSLWRTLYCLSNIRYVLNHNKEGHEQRSSQELLECNFCLVISISYWDCTIYPLCVGATKVIRLPWASCGFFFAIGVNTWVNQLFFHSRFTYKFKCTFSEFKKK